MRNSINAIQILRTHGIQPSKPRIAICEYIMTHHTHPTVEDVYKGLCTKIASLSLTTVYNTLRLFSEHGVAQMITINDHNVCYDGNTTPHVHSASIAVALSTSLRNRCLPSKKVA